MTSIDPLNLSYFFFGVACLLTGIYVVRRVGNETLYTVTKIKKIKEGVLTNFLTQITNVEDINKKLITQKELIDAYDNETINEALNIIRQIRIQLDMLDTLEDTKLLSKINHYLSGQVKMLNALLAIERESLEFQKEYQLKVNEFNEDFNKYKETEPNPERLLSYKREIINDLDLIKEHVVIALKNVRFQREEFYNEIVYSQKLLNELKLEISNYIEKKVRSKRFYPRYLTFI